MNDRGIILLAEDEKNDVFFFRQAIAKTGLQLPLQVVSDGIETISYLSGTEEFRDRSRYPFPSLLIIDLKMPKKSGLEVLAWLRTKTDLPPLKVLVLSSSAEPGDIQQAYALGADQYIVKPVGLDGLRVLVRGLADYWNHLGEVNGSGLLHGAIPRPVPKH